MQNQPNNESGAEIVNGLCRDCPFYEDLHGQASNGEINPPLSSGVCRRHAPLHVQALDPAKVPDTVISGIRPGIWPIVRGVDYCGDHPLRAASYQVAVERMKFRVAELERGIRRRERRAETGKGV